MQIVVVADPDMSALLARNWWAMALCGLFGGLFGILFGIIVFVWPVATMLSLLWCSGPTCWSTASCALWRQYGRRSGTSAGACCWLRGVISILMGLIAAPFPSGAVLAFIIVTAAWALLTMG